MSDAPQELQRLVPEKLTVAFSKSRIFHCLLLAIGMHLLLVVVTSIGYVRDTWIDPEGAARRKAAALAARKAEEEGAAGSAAAPTSDAAGARPSTAAAAAKTPDGAELEKRKDAPVIKQITEKAKKGEIPKEPDGLGISIDETNP